MEEKQVVQDSVLIEWIVELVDELGPFKPGTFRENKWRTTEQLANSIFEKWGQEVKLDYFTEVLLKYEDEARDRLSKNLPPNALIRRATYPDRTTVLPLWGSTKYHGQPWLDQAQQHRNDKPEDAPIGRHVPEGAPHIFLSHTHRDKDLAVRLACSLAKLGIGTWMFETDIEHHGNIANCVKEAIDSTSGCIALVTRDSMASLWVLSELDTVTRIGKSVTLVIDMEDDLLIRLFRSIYFPNPEAMYDLSVVYDTSILEKLSDEYKVERYSDSRADRYKTQVHDFLATLPLYLAGRPAIAYPDLPTNWQGTVELALLPALHSRINSSTNSSS